MLKSYDLRWFLSLILINLIALWFAYGLILAVFPVPIPEEYKRELELPIRIRLTTNEIKVNGVAILEGYVFAPDAPLANVTMKVDILSIDGKSILESITKTDTNGGFSILINPIPPGQYIVNFTIIDTLSQRQMYAVIPLKVLS